MSEICGTIFNIQRFSTDDGPGVRTTVFMKGCPLSCTWCANPESQAAHIQIVHRASKCRGCGKCVSVCPEKAISIIAGGEKPEVKIDRTLCTNCCRCVEVCTPGAMHIYGEHIAAKEAFDVVKRDAGYYMRSGGGVTVSGGEPMMQTDFVSELFSLCKNVGIHTTLDTCGFFPSEKLSKVNGLVDLVLFDLKIIDPETHKLYTGVDNRLIHDNLRELMKTDAEIIIRVPLIPEITDTEENLKAIAEFVKELERPLHIDLLPYHNYGENKYKMLDMPYALSEAKRQSDEKLAACLKLFTDADLDCQLHSN
ncbi:MAG: glycyl-radical enzyme activating protein [Oscillospiraceae bacterium]|nr:glycyl-radical enzyme activating protein [Oscillospiraceae bacterium]